MILGERGLRQPTSPAAVCWDNSLRFVILIVDGVSIGQHALMQDARNQYTAALLLAVKHDMLAMLQTAQARANVFTEPA